ncbi:MAG TPA: endopygalactorunase, partial [Chitinophagaceae bacterium]
MTLMIHACAWVNIIAQKPVVPKSSAEIIPNNATHIRRITRDSIIFITGSTYSFTVDTPEDSGLVLTNTTVKQLLSQIKSKDGSVQQYLVADKDGNKKDDGYLLSGDRLTVTSQDGKTKKTYSIAAVAMALSSRLRLGKKELTATTNSDLTLYFTAGQRTPDATVKIYIPKGITITEDNTTVNVIGRGAVKLKDLATQSIGRVGDNYPYKKVGNFSITKLVDGSSLLLFKHLDLRPSNDVD